MNPRSSFGVIGKHLLIRRVYLRIASSETLISGNSNDAPVSRERASEMPARWCCLSSSVARLFCPVRCLIFSRYRVRGVSLITQYSRGSPRERVVLITRGLMYEIAYRSFPTDGRELRPSVYLTHHNQVGSRPSKQKSSSFLGELHRTHR